ncbi:MAG: metal ABC transporter permease [Planctomycetota bacterium]|nr:metal ABC transporter permease [Planctomycetota bacterium]
MNTLHYLTSPDLWRLYWPGVVAGVALAALCSALSVLVVLKRLAFIGQGVSHAAFGGVGVVALVGLTGALASSGPLGGLGAVVQFAIIFAFCLGAALLIGLLSGRAAEPDTAIGIVLVASMAAGAIMLHYAPSTVSWETFLFGSIIDVAWTDAGVAWGVALLAAGALWWFRRSLVFWAFDPVVARAMGVRHAAMNVLLMTLLALATVTAMKLAGVVLATALLVLPGAVALRLSTRWRPVLVTAAVTSGIGVLAGIILSFEMNWPTGPSIVCVLAVLFALARAGDRVRARVAPPAGTAP